MAEDEPPRTKGPDMPMTGHEVDPGGWQTATCEHCDGHIQRKPGRMWMHTRNARRYCYGAGGFGTAATPRKHPEDES